MTSEEIIQKAQAEIDQLEKARIKINEETDFAIETIRRKAQRQIEFEANKSIIGDLG